MLGVNTQCGTYPSVAMNHVDSPGCLIEGTKKLSGRDLIVPDIEGDRKSRGVANQLANQLAVIVPVQSRRDD